MTQFGKTRIKS